jgi:hypothetical protein
MKSSKYLIAQGPSLGVSIDNLKQYYAEDERKRREHGQRMEHNRAQQLQVDQREGIGPTLGLLSNFSQTAGAYAKQQKQFADIKLESDRLKAQVDFSKLDTKSIEIINKLIQESGDKLKFDGAVFKKKVNASEELTPAVKRLINSQHGSSIYRLHEQFGFHVIDSLDSYLEQYYKDNPSFQSKVTAERLSGNYIGEQNLYKQVAYERFAALRFNEDFVTANFEKPLTKLLDTKGAMAKLYYDTQYLSELEIEFDRNIDTAKKQLESNPTALTDEINSQLVADNNYKPRTVARLYRLAKAGKLTRNEIYAIKDGKLPPELKYAAGSLGKALFSDEQWESIERGVDEFEANAVNTHTTRIQQSANTTLAAIYQGTESIEQLEAMKREALLALSRAGLQDTKIYKRLDNTDVSIQKPESYAAAAEKYSPYITGNKIGHRLKDLEDFDSIGQGRLSQELKNLAAADAKYFRGRGLPDTHEGFVKAAEGVLAKSTAAKNVPTKIDHTSDEFKYLSYTIAIKRQELHAQARLDHPDNDIKAFGQAELLFNQWLEANGANEIDNNGQNPRARILSPNLKGQYQISKERRMALFESSQLGTKGNVNAWSQNLITAHTQSGGNKEKALNTANSLTSHGDIQGVFINSTLDAKGKPIPNFSPEIIFKARALRIQPAQLILRQLQALKTSDDPRDKNFYNRHNLKQYEELLKNDPAIKIEEALVNMADDKGQKLLFLWRNGVENMTANQITRLIDSLSGFKWSGNSFNQGFPVF